VKDQARHAFCDSGQLPRRSSRLNKTRQTSNDLNSLAAVQMAAEHRPNLSKSGLRWHELGQTALVHAKPQGTARFFNFELPSIGLGSGMCRSTRFCAYFGSSWTQVARGNGPPRWDRSDDAEV
jgi:hypothetical protein